MSIFSLTVGLVVRHGERTWRLERHLEDGTLVFVDQITAMPKTLSVAQLFKELQAKRLALVSGDRALQDGAHEVPLIFDPSALSGPMKTEFELRVQVIALLRSARVTRGQRQAIGEVLKQAVASGRLEWAPKPSTVMAWMRRIENAQGSMAALVSGHATRRAVPRLDDGALGVAGDMLRTHYCTLARRPLAETLEVTNRAIKERVTSGQLSAAAKPISLSTLRRMKERIPAYDRFAARYGKECARNKWRYSLRGEDLTRAMQIYEIDHTVVDLVVVSDATGMPLGRPTITVVVDAYSGYVVGFFVSFLGAGLRSALGALKVALQPKDDYIIGAALELPWLGMGLCEMIRVDNGLEFHSPQFSLVAFRLAMDLQYCAVRQPWLKPVVERTLGKYLQYLPTAGRVRRAVTNELPQDSRKTAAVAFSAFCHGLLQAFVEVHPQEINQRRLIRPYDLFRESLEELPPPSLALPGDELDIIVAPSKSLTVGQCGGIETQYLRYNSIELQGLRREIGTTFRALVKFDPENLGSVYLQHPRTPGWLHIPCTRPDYAEGLSIVQHKAIRALAKDELNRRNAEEALSRAKLRLIDHWAEHTRTGKKLAKDHLRAMAGLTSSQVLAGPTPPARPAAKLLTLEDARPVAPAEIPEFETFEA